jgi:transcriptional regulator with XRE-family HTH domain
MQLQTGISFRTCTLLARATIVTKQANRPPGEDAVPTRPGPTVQRRRLGIELRRLRETAGKTIDEVAQVLECSDSKVSRIENGQVSASPRDVRDMLEFYGVDSERRDALVEVTRSARQKGWWQAYSDAPVMPLVGLEVVADQIHAYEAMAVPGLLQTRDYARAMISALRPGLPDDQIDRWVDLRMIRQELLARETPPLFLAILEECVLRRPVGGHLVMLAQLEHLVMSAAMPSLTLQVLPLSVGVHSAMYGAFAVYRFAEPTDPDVVYFEQDISDLYLENPEQVAWYDAAFERLRSAALNPEDSLHFLEDLIRNMEQLS